MVCASVFRLIPGFMEEYGLMRLRTSSGMSRIDKGRVRVKKRRLEDESKRYATHTYWYAPQFYA